MVLESYRLRNQTVKDKLHSDDSPSNQRLSHMSLGTFMNHPLSESGARVFERGVEQNERNSAF